MKTVLAISSFNGDLAAVERVSQAIPVRDRGLVAKVAVVDSGDPDRCRLLKETLLERAAGIDYISHIGNLGAAGNLLVRIDWATRNGADLLLAVNADGTIIEENVQRLLSLFADPDVAAAYPLAVIHGRWVDLSPRRGVPVLPSRKRIGALPLEGSLPVRWGSSNGAMYRLSCLQKSNVNQIRHLWHGWEDLALGLLLDASGFRQLLHLEARQPTASDQRTVRGGLVVSAKPPWTTYYGVRNLLLLARLHPSEFGRIALRIVREFVAILIRPRRVARYRLATRGLVDGIRNRGGWAAHRGQRDDGTTSASSPELQSRSE